MHFPAEWLFKSLALRGATFLTLLPLSFRILLRVKPNLSVFIHRPRITVLSQVGERCTSGTDVKTLFTCPAVATIVKPFVLFLATSRGYAADGRFLSRSAHVR